MSAITTDVHGNRYAQVHVEELDEWAWMLGQPRGLAPARR